jgi:hypothetical protein
MGVPKRFRARCANTKVSVGSLFLAWRFWRRPQPAAHTDLFSLIMGRRGAGHECGAGSGG